MTLPLHSSPNILIASADSEATDRVRNVLSKWRYPVQVVADGVEGLKVLTGQTPPGIALIDAGLPEGLTVSNWRRR
jgi:CheY-like chemotaxis protein